MGEGRRIPSIKKNDRSSHERRSFFLKIGNRDFGLSHRDHGVTRARSLLENMLGVYFIFH
ncbi:MAG: hypothetical protein F6K18_29220 [Okeania sp. SIO2C2]|uniref:hypothetical protein n=1 Tax=Okeania sp. SIO2C2 TaxID=2607787 RepID=UPI0013B851C0|nr:hypothetical protein [Okeania sp. SIO2C2]NEP90569.1 hypothetical protein [Okeania sp. SIO2C2]